ncbi:hypothetical protein BH11PSE13_BH11PSE13_38270 [soil metagenome]
MASAKVWHDEIGVTAFFRWLIIDIVRQEREPQDVLLAISPNGN